MSSIVKEHLARVHSSSLMKPLVAAAGALVAWKYLPSMTEELWNHALLFLDRHRYHLSSYRSGLAHCLKDLTK